MMSFALAKAGSTPTTSVSRSRRRAIQDYKVRVAVWDMDSAFPEIQRTLDALNAAQKVFGFELVSLSLPIRAWDLENKSPDNTPYLWAERLVKQVKRVLPELRVDMLICITGHWLRNDDTLNLFASWGGETPATVFSCAGLNLEPAGQETDRAIANVLVELLVGFRGDMGSHPDGAKNCPLYYNESRDRSLIVGRQQFDAECRQALEAKLSIEEMTALDALLDTFS